MALFQVFTRTWYKKVHQKYGPAKLVPHMGRKTNITTASSYEEAVKICQEWNNSHNPGELSRKAEFTRIG